MNFPLPRSGEGREGCATKRNTPSPTLARCAGEGGFYVRTGQTDVRAPSSSGACPTQRRRSPCPPDSRQMRSSRSTPVRRCVISITLRPVGDLVQRGEERALGFRIQPGARFVEDQDRRRRQQRTRQRQPPPLTAGEACAALADPGVETIRQRAHHLADPRRIERAPTAPHHPRRAAPASDWRGSCRRTDASPARASRSARAHRRRRAWRYRRRRAAPCPAAAPPPSAPARPASTCRRPTARAAQRARPAARRASVRRTPAAGRAASGSAPLEAQREAGRHRGTAAADRAPAPAHRRPPARDARQPRHGRRERRRAAVRPPPRTPRPPGTRRRRRPPDWLPAAISTARMAACPHRNAPALASAVRPASSCCVASSVASRACTAASMRPSAPNARTSRSPVSASSAAMRSAPVAVGECRAGTRRHAGAEPRQRERRDREQHADHQRPARRCAPRSARRGCGSSRTAPASGTRMRR